MNQISEIDAVGNVKIFNPTRLKYFLATLKSFSFLKNELNIYVNVENGRFLKKALKKFLKREGFKKVFVSSEKKYFNETYTYLLNKCSNSYVLNLEDDHFCELDDKDEFFKIINGAYKNDVEIIRSTFFKLNNKLFENCNKIKHNELFSIINYNKDLFSNYKSNKPYFIQNNCVFSKDFALKHWSKSYNSFKPHPHEVQNFKSKYSHILLIPKIEILRPIDDDHGIPNSCCLNNNSKKWIEIYENINLDLFKFWILYYKIMFRINNLNIRSHLQDFFRNKVDKIKKTFKLFCV